MLNYEIFDKAVQPTETEIKDFVKLGLLEDLDSHLQKSYKVKPKLAYSNCSMNNNIWRGWNIKYQKSGKSLCTLYPQDGYFMVLVPGQSFEVRNEETLVNVKLAVEMRADAITTKKR